MELITKNESDIFLENGKDKTTPQQLFSPDGIRVRVTLQTNGTASIQESVDGIIWYDCPDSEIACSPSGEQTFVEVLRGQYMRVVSATQITEIKILS